MRIIVAKDAGYCFGVRDAVNLAYQTAREQGQVYMLGHIVHNERVVQDLARAGAVVVDSLDEIPDGAPVLFRAHGTPTETWEQARKKGTGIIDATCPLVYEIHDQVKALKAEKRKIIIIGDHGHDEVLGIASQVDDPIVVSSPDEARALSKVKRAGVVSQSTQSLENVQAILAILLTKVYDLRFVNTICFPTKRNQSQLMELAREVDVMIVIGSFTSANSMRLTSLARERNPRSYQVTGAGDIDPRWFEGAHTVGVSAGASTPEELIEAVTVKIKTLGSVKEEVYG